MKNKIIVENTKILKNKIIDSGYNGICYLTKDNMVYKEFYEESKRQDIDSKLLNYHIKSFAFPKVLVFDKNNKYVGYIRKYIDGTTLEYINDNVNINKFIVALEKYEHDLMYLSREGLLLYDLSMDNLIYTTSDELISIDTDLFGYYFKDKNITFKRNIETLSNIIIEKFLGLDMYDADIELFKRNCTVYCENKPSELLNYTLDKIIKLSTDKINDINDYDYGLKLVKKEEKSKVLRKI